MGVAIVQALDQLVGEFLRFIMMELAYEYIARSCSGSLL